MPKKYDIKESKDEKCPYCRSEFVMKTGSEEDMESWIKELPKGGIFFKCYTCNKVFFCLEPKDKVKSS